MQIAREPRMHMFRVQEFITWHNLRRQQCPRDNKYLAKTVVINAPGLCGWNALAPTIYAAYNTPITSSGPRVTSIP